MKNREGSLEMRKIISLIFIVILIMVIGLYLSYVYINDQFIWIAGILLIGGTIFNWYLYNKYLVKKR